MTKLVLRALFGCMMLGLVLTPARAADCAGTISEDEALKAGFALRRSGRQ